ncbi:MAG: hypothetical protein AUG51_03235 [Acidobacteria bacterium 13_1_20CM_3_53_8]|nr:MAG: hypothetical protein AUG51_03235 [Acidobacteria bacterium 13_1_20CM_3_53_8]
MQESKIRAYLETATNIAVLAVSILILSLLAVSFFSKGSKTEFNSGLQKGKQFAQLPAVDYSASRQTLVIALSSKCGYCRESLPFYKQVAESQGNNKITRILALSPETKQVADQFLEQNQLSLEAIPSVELNAYSIDATPTIILLDSKGIIIDFWVGKLPERVEQQILDAINVNR